MRFSLFSLTLREVSSELISSQFSQSSYLHTPLSVQLKDFDLEMSIFEWRSQLRLRVKSESSIPTLAASGTTAAMPTCCLDTIRPQSGW